MLGWLEALVNNFVCWVETAIVDAVNALIAGLGAVVSALVAILPGMPSLPARPAEFDTATGWINWVFPVGTVVNIVGFALGVWLLWQAVAIGLRWAKAIGT